jgi:hypothetical protein
MKCIFCGKEFENKKNAHNVKYCSIVCRNKEYYKRSGGADAQREYLEKYRLKDSRPKIKCQICGKFFRQVGSHIVQRHGITAREYREEYGFDVKKGQLPEDYRKLKAEQAVECGGIKNLKSGKKFWFKKGQKGIGKYRRSKQTMDRLKQQSFIKKNI